MGARMRFFEQVAQSIVEQTFNVLKVPMSITDEKGLIIGCTDVNRIGSYHEATKEVFKAGRAVQYSEENVIGRENVLPGVAAPIFFKKEPIGVLGIVGDPKDIIKYVYLVRNHVEMLLQETMKAESFSLQLKVTENFIQYLLHYRQDGNKEELKNYCEMIGFDVEIPRICILIHIPHHVMESNKRTIKILQYDLFHLICKLFKDGSDDIITSINIKQWLVLKGVKENDAGKIIEESKNAIETINHFLHQHQIQGKAFLVMGNSYKGAEGIRRSYQQAIKLLSVAKKSSIVVHSVYSYYDWNVLMKCLIEEINPSFLESIVESVSDLINHPNSNDLIETFLTYCAEGLNMSKSARKLHIHRNTLLYRLNLINDILQINVNSFEQSMFLYLTLKGRSLHKGDSEVKLSDKFGEM
jgi:carbohydrate diacid regulator